MSDTKYSLKQLDHLKSLGVSEDIISQLKIQRRIGDNPSPIDKEVLKAIEPAFTFIDLASEVTDRLERSDLAQMATETIAESYKDFPLDFLNDIENVFYNPINENDDEAVRNYCQTFDLDFAKISALVKTSHTLRLVIGEFKD